MTASSAQCIRTVFRPLLVVLALVVAPLEAAAGVSESAADPRSGAADLTAVQSGIPLHPGAGQGALDRGLELDGPDSDRETLASGPRRVVDRTPALTPGCTPSGVASRLHLGRCGHLSHRLDLPPPASR